jgi:hypothetical protein
MYCSIHYNQLSLATLSFLVVWRSGIELRPDSPLRLTVSELQAEILI